MEKLYGNFINNTLISGPIKLPDIFVTTNGDTIFGFNKYALTNPTTLIKYNWYEIYDPEVLYDKDYERVTYSAWYIDDNNILTRKHVKQYISFANALTIAFNKLDKNREAYEVGGFEYDYYGISVLILTDKESSQGKLTASQISANNGIRADTDTWKFIKKADGSAVVVSLSNSDLDSICNFVFRKIQDAYNLTSQIAWQMLGCKTTENLKKTINNGSIKLNPWQVDDTPWEY